MWHASAPEKGRRLIRADSAEDVLLPGPVPKAMRKNPAPRNLLGRWGAAAICLMAVLVMAGTMLQRERVVAALPVSAGLFEALGLPVNLRGLALRDLKTVEMNENGTPVLIVSGTIQNVRTRPVNVPKLRFAVREASGREIYVWAEAPARDHLAPGDAQRFWARLAAPPPDGQAVAVRFADKGEALLAANERVR
ncbi:FxLYD domain-containing protein [Terrihabitans sp. B22-R8]|uniref:FxLYD domain-containing protein n=1 Tax=Terrihabitans sp. B22-R8 TaxID=3425128 RepID=UPI00403C57CC